MAARALELINWLDEREKNHVRAHLNVTTHIQRIIIVVDYAMPHAYLC